MTETKPNTPNDEKETPEVIILGPGGFGGVEAVHARQAIDVAMLSQEDDQEEKKKPKSKIPEPIHWPDKLGWNG